MADQTPIEWTDATWNIITGCSVVSPGCTNCYAMKLAGTRLQHHPSRAGLTVDSRAGPVWNGQVRFNAEWLTQPLRWTRPRMIFVCAHGDLFHEGVPDDWLDQIFAVMALCPQHTFQVLTKRPERMRAYLANPTARRLAMNAVKLVSHPPSPFGLSKDRVLADRDRTLAIWRSAQDRLAGCYLPNVWLGVSVEDQTRADERIPVLLDTPAAVRWISAEPLLGPVSLRGLPGLPTDDECVRINALEGKWRTSPRDEEGHAMPRLDWVVAGGESGPGARPMHPDWARQLRDQCAEAGVPFLFKQWGEWAPGECATNTVGRTVETADWFNDRWDFETLTPASAEGMHIDDEPTLYRAGKKAAGRLLDGQIHDGFPTTAEARG